MPVWYLARRLHLSSRLRLAVYALWYLARRVVLFYLADGIASESASRLRLRLGSSYRDHHRDFRFRTNLYRRGLLAVTQAPCPRPLDCPRRPSWSFPSTRSRPQGVCQPCPDGRPRWYVYPRPNG